MTVDTLQKVLDENNLSLTFLQFKFGTALHAKWFICNVLAQMIYTNNLENDQGMILLFKK